jgi:hypothetical protein
MATNVGAAGTTITFGSTVSRVRRIGHSQKSDEIDITNLSSTDKEYLTGFTEREITIEVFGCSSTTIGATGNLTINWNDGTTRGPYSVIVTGIDENGEVGGAITTSLTFKKTSA